MAESKASGPLHHLMTEITGVKSQWEAMVDRISLAYGDAYKRHVGALDLVRKKRAEVQNANREVMQLMFGITTMGFAGGAVGSLFAPWTKAVEHKVVQYAFREGVKGAVDETTQKVTENAMKKIFDGKWGSSGSGPLDPSAPQPWEQYLEKKTKLDICFGLVNETLTSLINLANAEQWSESIGQNILDGWRKSCPLLTDAPKEADAPDRRTLARGAEILMWSAWCMEQDWKWWKKQYDNMNFLFVTDPSKDFYLGNPDFRAAVDAVQYAHEFRPVRFRTLDLVGSKATINIDDKWRKKMGNLFVGEVIDLRILGPHVQWTNLIPEALPAVVDVEKAFGKTIPTMLSDFNGFKLQGGALVDQAMPLKPFFKRPQKR
jgi:hypothetical protein